MRAKSVGVGHSPGRSVVGIDIGCSLIKIAAVRPDGTLAAAGTTSTWGGGPRVTEVDGIALWARVADLLAEVAADATGAGAPVGGIAVCGFGEGLILAAADGSLAGPIVMANDRRGTDLWAAWGRDGVRARALAAGGQDVAAASPAVLLAVAAKTGSHDVTQARYGLSVKDWVHFQLTGRLATDRTDAAAWFASATEPWSDSIRTLWPVGGSHARLGPPSILPAGTAHPIRPGVAENYGLDDQLSVAIGCHDTVAAAVGAGRGAVGGGHLQIGTFSVAQLVLAEPRLAPGISIRPSPVGPGWCHQLSRLSSEQLRPEDLVAQLADTVHGRSDLTRARTPAPVRSAPGGPPVPRDRPETPPDGPFLGVQGVVSIGRGARRANRTECGP